MRSAGHQASYHKEQLWKRHPLPMEDLLNTFLRTLETDPRLSVQISTAARVSETWFAEPESAWHFPRESTNWQALSHSGQHVNAGPQDDHCNSSTDSGDPRPNTSRLLFQGSRAILMACQHLKEIQQSEPPQGQVPAMEMCRLTRKINSLMF